MKCSVSGLNFIKKWEGLCLTSYKCQAGVWTIGYGSTFYPDGSKVNKGDTITKAKADELFAITISKFEKAVTDCNLKLKQNQFDALVSFTFNVGIGAFYRSVLLKLIKNEPNDLKIKEQFLKWNKVRQNGILVPSRGLTRRRKEESNMYFQ